MKRKKEGTSREKRRLSNKQFIILSVILASIITLGFVLSSMLLQAPSKFSLSATIIDQLGENFPNPQFVEDVTNILETAGFKVTYYRSENLDVSFFKGLAKCNYGLIILRVHSALREGGSTVDLFTSEEFKSSAHVPEQNNGLLVKGILNYSQGSREYFALTSEFIKNLEGRFPKSVVVAMGCWSLKPGCEQMAEAFCQKGCQAYVGWTEMVEIGHTDNETVKLLRMLLEENKTIGEAVRNTSPDLLFPGSEMRYYPQSAGNLTISDLIAEAEASATLQSLFLTTCVEGTVRWSGCYSNITHVNFLVAVKVVARNVARVRVADAKNLAIVATSSISTLRSALTSPR